MKLRDYLKFDEYNKAYFKVKITPKQPKNEFFSVMNDGTLKLRIKAVPEKWKANKEVISYFSDELNINKKDIEIISWTTDSVKIIRICKN